MNGTTPMRLLVRRNILAIGTILLLGLLGLRFFQYQILYHDQYTAYAENNSIRTVRLPAPRGMILDRFGRFLVTNRPQYSLAVIPAEVQHSVAELRKLARYLHMDEDALFATLEEAGGVYRRYQPLTIYEDVSYIQRSYLEEHRLEYPGIFFVDRAIRHYPSRARATHIIGYLRNLSAEDLDDYRDQGYHLGDWFGATGLERQFEHTLKGLEGVSYRRVDYLLRDLGGIPDRPLKRPTAGANVTLALDIDMQAKAEQLMEGNRGVLIAMDPRNGELLAYVSSPDYVLAPFTGSIPPELWEQWLNHPEKVMLNRPINGLYPPGSTLKLVLAAAVLADPHIDPKEKIECTGFYQYGNRVFRCNNLAGHGFVDLEDAIRVSCNIYFYQVMQLVTFTKWVEMARAFGFGQPTGVDLPQELEGLIPTQAYMHRKYGPTGWAGGHVLIIGLGQGDVLVTPLQVARMTAAIANRGRLVTPKLVISPRQAGDKEVTMNLPPSVWDYLQRSMYLAINGVRGTGFRARVPGADIYGKTGTAEVAGSEPHSWFTGYVITQSGLPLVVTVLVEEGGLGSRKAAPLAGEMFKYFIDQYDPVEETGIAQVP